MITIAHPEQSSGELKICHILVLKINICNHVTCTCILYNTMVVRFPHPPSLLSHNDLIAGTFHGPEHHQRFSVNETKKKTRMRSRWRAIANPLLIVLIAERTDRQIDGLALTHPYHERKSCSKFDYIPPSSLERDSVSDKWTEK